ncbi:hypothetical protein [Kitasatospora sp. NPDC005748]|uniref:hypothetical protein n=1 Tax=Kitasatospora sp. NPDC005748 TaxID=3157063 RepID=UPI00340BB071
MEYATAQRTDSPGRPDGGEPGNGGRQAALRVDEGLLVLAAAVLDHGVPLFDRRSGDAAAEVARRLRSAVGRPSQTPDRQHLAVAVENALRDRSGRARCVVEVATVEDAVAYLRRVESALAGEALGRACRRLWEALYLCIPLTTILSRPAWPPAAGFSLADAPPLG